MACRVGTTAAPRAACQYGVDQRLLLLLLFELELDERLDDEFDEVLDELLLLPARWLRPSLVRPTASAARRMPRSHPPKKLCTAVSPRGLRPPLVLELFDELFDELDELLDEELLEELFDELLEELLDEFDEEFDDELDELFEDELDDDPDERPPEPLDELLELLLPALNLCRAVPCSASCASAPRPLRADRSCAGAAPVAMRPATVVAMAPILCFMKSPRWFVEQGRRRWSLRLSGQRRSGSGHSRPTGKDL
jgi:hypothetical protein